MNQLSAGLFVGALRRIVIIFQFFFTCHQPVDYGAEHHRRKRLGQVGICPQVESFRLVVFRYSGRNDYQRNMAGKLIRFHTADQFHPIDLRHHNIRNNQGRRLFFHQTDRLFHTVSLHYRISLR